MRLRRFSGPGILFGILSLALMHLSGLAAWAIGGYRAHVAPALGIHCGFARTTGKESCSAYAARVITEKGFWRGLSLARKRFHACGAIAKGNSR